MGGQIGSAAPQAAAQPAAAPAFDATNYSGPSTYQNMFSYGSSNPVGVPASGGKGGQGAMPGNQGALAGLQGTKFTPQAFTPSTQVFAASEAAKQAAAAAAPNTFDSYQSRGWDGG